MTLRLSNDTIIIRALPKKIPLWKIVIIIVIVLRGVWLYN